MKLVRKGLITEEEAIVLLEAIKQRREIVFPLARSEAIAVMKTIRNCAEKSTNTPSIFETLLAKWNYSYASVTTFALWLGPKNLTLEQGTASDGRSGLRVRIESDNNIDWDALKNDGLTRCF